MGSRTQWAIKTHANGDAIHLYSHSGGESKFYDTRAALLAAQPRWNDVAYGSRIFISNIIGDNWASETGFGLLAGDHDEILFEESYYPSIIDFPLQLVTMGEQTWSFAEFLLAEDVQEALVEQHWATAYWGAYKLPQWQTLT
jgi:hypothetical protein